MSRHVCPEHRDEPVNHRGKGCRRCAVRDFGPRPQPDPGSGYGALLDAHSESASEPGGSAR